MTDEQCAEWWGPGVRYGVHFRCVRPAKHTGPHRNGPRDLSWTGKMTDSERAFLAMWKEEPDGDDG